MSRRSKFALEETLVAITPLQLDPAHADEIIQIARQAPSLQSGSENDIDGIHILRFKTLVELYHDDPSLLDKILVELVDCLISQVVLSENPEDLLNQSSIMSLILLKVVTVVRGYKTIIRLLPHEVYLLPKLLALLENYSKLEKFTELEYEAICMLLVWFMIVCRNPFDFNLFAQEDEVSYPIRITKCLVSLQPHFRKYVSLTLAETLTRHDSNALLLEPLLESCLTRLKNHEENSFLQQGIDLELLSSIFKKGKRHELAKYGASIIQSLDSYLNLEMNNSNAKLQMVKLIQRIGLIYLKPKPANWRYKCGVRSLEENLKIVEPKMENISQETDEVAELDPETQKLIDTILKSLLIGIQDKENNVRTSAAKGIGRIAARLPKEKADSVIQQVLENNFVGNAPAGYWHGGAMTIAELSQRGCILPERLPAVMDVISKALQFDDAHSTAVNVRDAACYICWASARGFEPVLMAPFVEKLASKLIVTALFDRSVNVRRAASAAFQENVGRSKGFPHGIRLNTLVDYQAVTRINHCYESLCLEVAEFSEYVIPMLDTLSDVFAIHFQERIRMLAAGSLRFLAKYNPGHVVNQLIPRLKDRMSSSDVDTKQGSLLALGGLIRGLNESKTFITEEIEQLEQIKAEIPILAKKYNSAATTGSQLILRAIATFICDFATTETELTDQELENWQKIADRIASDLNPETRECGEPAIESLMWYYTTNISRISMLNSLIKQYFLKLKSFEYEHERIGAAVGLGSIRSESLKLLTDDVTVHDIIDRLIFSIQEKPVNQWVYARSAAISSMASLVLKSEISKIDKEKVLECLFVGIRDNTKTIHGLVGQIVRKAAITALVDLLPFFEKVGILEEEELGRAIYLIIEQCCERIDKLREFAASSIKTMLEQHILSKIPERELLYSIFVQKEIKWRVDGFDPMAPLLTSKFYRIPMILGIINSIGCETSIWIQNLGLNQLQLHFRKNHEETNEFFDLILTNLEAVEKKADMVPVVRAFGRVFGEGCFYEAETNPDKFPKLLEIANKIKDASFCGTVPMKKAALEVCQFLFQCKIGSSVFKVATTVLTTLLKSKMAAIRQAAAQQLQHAVIALDITNGVEIEDLEPILHQLLGRIWRDDTEDFSELADKVRANIVDLIQKYSQK